MSKMDGRKENVQKEIFMKREGEREKGNTSEHGRERGKRNEDRKWACATVPRHFQFPAFISH